MRSQGLYVCLCMYTHMYTSVCIVYLFVHASTEGIVIFQESEHEFRMTNIHIHTYIHTYAYTEGIDLLQEREHEFRTT